MSLQQWHENGWIRQTKRSGVEVSNQLQLAQREIADGSGADISSDGRFLHAYSAVRTLCQVALHAAGYAVAKGESGHQRAIESLKFTLGGKWNDEADHFDQCRRMRHRLAYDCSGLVQQRDADELLAAAQKLQGDVVQWLHKNHADLV